MTRRVRARRGATEAIGRYWERCCDGPSRWPCWQARPLPAPPAAGVARPAPTTAPAPEASIRSEALGHRIASTALDLRGAPYRNGGTTPAGFDCSGFVQLRPRALWPRVAAPDAATSSTKAQRVSRGDIRAGDLVFFSTVAPGASHVGIALDDEEFVHAPSSRGVVRVERLATEYWRKRFVGARRIR